MKGSLVGTQFNRDVSFGQLFPEVNYIALVSHRNGFFSLPGLNHSCDEIVEVGIHFVDPALGMPFFNRPGIDLGNHAYRSGND